MEKFLSPADVCELVPGMSESLLAQMRFRGDGPRFIKVSPRKVAYAESAISDYMASREVVSTRDVVGVS